MNHYPLKLPLEVTKADLSLEGNVTVLESDNEVCLSLPKASLKEGRSFLSKICSYQWLWRKQVTCIYNLSVSTWFLHQRWVGKD